MSEGPSTQNPLRESIQSNSQDGFCELVGKHRPVISELESLYFELWDRVNSDQARNSEDYLQQTARGF